MPQKNELRMLEQEVELEKEEKREEETEMSQLPPSFVALWTSGDN